MYEKYLKVCKEAAVNPEVFKNFRRNPDYTEILEHVTEDQGAEYMRLLTPGGLAANHVWRARENDKVGDPRLMSFGQLLKISPTTLRYLKVADDLEQMFGGLDGKDVIEIGGGYGGQCRILDMLFKIRSYTLIDRQEALSLAARYLSNFEMATDLLFLRSGRLLNSGGYFVISNYALTELPAEDQIKYYVRVLQKSAGGYITYNNVTPELNQLTLDEWTERLMAKVTPERPLTHPGNCILTWNRFAETGIK